MFSKTSEFCNVTTVGTCSEHSIVARWRNYFSQLFNVHGVKGVGQAEIHTAEPLVPEPSAAEIELAINKLKSHKLPGIIKYQQN